MREEIEVRDNLLEMLRQEAIEASQTLKAATQVMFKDSGTHSSYGNHGVFVISVLPGCGDSFCFSISYHEPCAQPLLLQGDE